MDLWSDAQIAEQITIYEDKIKNVKTKIREELITRRDLKAKIKEAKNRETTQLLILDRLDEYEKIVNKQLELTEKMEDSESAKQLAVLNKYENMLSDQQIIWAAYKEEYEKLPLAKKRQEREIKFLKINIQNNLILYKIQETKRIIRMKNEIAKRKEQIQIVQFAKLYKEHIKRAQCCYELMHKINNLKMKERELRSEVHKLKRQAAEIDKLGSALKETSIKSQKLPQIDLSRFIINRNNNKCNADTVSVNSYALEQEYMNTDDQMQVSPSDSNTQNKIDSQPTKNSNCESQESHPEYPDAQTMDVDDAEPSNQSNEPPRKLSAEQVNKKARKLNFKEKVSYSCQSLKRQNHEQTNKQNNRMNNSNNVGNTFNAEDQRQQSQTLKMKNSDRRNEQDNILKINPFAAKKLNQANQLENQQLNERNTSAKRTNQIQPGMDNTAGSSFTNNDNQRIENTSPSRNGERPIPTPIKMVKRSSEDQKQSSDFNKDFTRLPQANTPQIKSFEHVNYSNVMQFQMIQKGASANIHAGPATMQDQLSSNMTAPSSKHHENQPINVSPSRDNFQRNVEQFGNITPTSVNVPSIPDTSMMSMVMHSGDPSMYAGDNISAILGSEITEPGGSFELARRLYADSDLNSEEGDIDYEKMMAKFCSPIATDPREHKVQQQKPVDTNNQNSNDDATAQSKSQEQLGNRNFTIGQFGNTQKTTSQRFF